MKNVFLVFCILCMITVLIWSCDQNTTVNVETDQTSTNTLTAVSDTVYVNGCMIVCTTTVDDKGSSVNCEAIECD